MVGAGTATRKLAKALTAVNWNRKQLVREGIAVFARGGWNFREARLRKWVFRHWTGTLNTTRNVNENIFGKMRRSLHATAHRKLTGSIRLLSAVASSPGWLPRAARYLVLVRDTPHRTTIAPPPHHHQKKAVRNSFPAGGPAIRAASLFYLGEHICRTGSSC